MCIRFELRFFVVIAALELCIVSSYADMGDLEASYNLEAAKFVLHPAEPYIYVSVVSANGIAIINTETLVLEETVFIGSNPLGLAISPDGGRLYCANSGSNFVGVFDTSTRTALPSLLVPEVPRDVEVGAGGVLYVLGADSLMQIDPLTGGSAGPDIGPSYMVTAGELAISSDMERLYYADYGSSPASLYQFDVTVSPAELLWESPHGGLSGSNGQDLAISRGGSFVSYACGYGQGGYKIAKYRTSDMAILGTFDTGAYPSEITFSPDEAIAYTVHTSGQIETWDTATFLGLGTIPTVGEAAELFVDRSGQHLFAGFSEFGETPILRVYDTGRESVGWCGDGVVDALEECDDEGESATCDANCTVAECGDGWINATANEECEPSGSGCCDASCQFDGAGTSCPGDNDPCTDDVCDGVGICLNIPIACDVGLVCVEGECVDLCVEGDCDDRHSCTEDSCDSGTGICINAPIECSEGEICVAGACVSEICKFFDTDDDGDIDLADFAEFQICISGPG